MRVIFAGTPDFARIALESLHRAGFDIPLVLTQPDRPAGRGMKLHPSPVKQFALEHGIGFAQPHSLRLDGRYPDDAAVAQAVLKAAAADAMVVAAYGLILPQWALEQPRLGCFNIHASLLPRWRGAAPIHRAIEAGDGNTGVTIMQMDAGLDTGDMLRTQTLPIAADETTGSLHDKLAALGATMIVDVLRDAQGAGLRPLKQPAEGVTYAHKIDKAQAQLDWSQPAAVLERRIRAFDPFPGAASSVNGEALKLWRADLAPSQQTSNELPGTLLHVDDSALSMQTGDGVLRVTQLQRAGGKRLAVADFRRGFSLAPGIVFGRRA